MTAAEDALLQRLETVLPEANAFVGSQSVFDEVKGSTRLEDAAELA